MSPSPARVSAGGSIADAEGFDLRPDPVRARTAADLIAALRGYRAWAGDPSYRKMASRASYASAASTICAALNSDTLPRLELVLAVVTGCGGDEEDQQRFATAWRAIRLEHASEAGGGQLSAAMRPLATVPDAGKASRG